MTPPLLQAEALGFAIDGQTLLTAIDFELAAGTCLGVIGPNGAGKSTLLQLLAGYLIPSQGLVRLHQTPLQALSPRQRARQVAVVSARETLPPFAMQVQDYLKLGRAPFQNWLGQWQASDQAALDRAVSQCLLEPLLTAPLSTLSSGEWQRVQLGRALTQSPQLLLLDEPTSHLDVSAQICIMHLLWQLSRQGLTVLCVVHDLNLAAQYMDQLLLLNRGQLVAQGSPAAVLSPEALQSVYNLKWEIRQDSHSQRPLILPRYH